MNFSHRTAWELTGNTFAAALHEARASGCPLLDLTLSNPTACGLAYDTAALLAPLSQSAASFYEPEPFGMMPARQAVSAYYRDHAATVVPGAIALTTSTSEAYSYLFRLLCDAGDEVLVATPSYPLFDFIARLDSVRLVTYPLLYHDAWFIDFHALEAAITPRTRAIIVVHPNNPTGHFCSQRERATIEGICLNHDLALIIDEVFLDYPINSTIAAPNAASSFATGPHPVLTFVLSGISKVCGLPQMKCSWIASFGPAPILEAAVSRLEIIADTFLSINAPTQHALPLWLEARHPLQQQILTRARTNLAALDTALEGSPCRRLTLEAGWTCILRVPRTVNAVDFATAALAHNVVVQPGEFYGLPPGRIVLSLLTPEDAWREGIQHSASLADG